MPDQNPQDLTAYLADLMQRRATLDLIIADVRKQLGLGADMSATPPTLPNGAPGPAGSDQTPGRVRSDEFFRLSMSQAISRYLQIMKAPQSQGAIRDALKSGGILSNARNFGASVNTELKRMKVRNLVVNTPSGWGLAEWYPQKPKANEAPKPKRRKHRVSKPTVKAPTPQTPKASDKALTWRPFLAQQLRDGHSMQEASAAWKARQGAN